MSCGKRCRKGLVNIRVVRGRRTHGVNIESKKYRELSYHGGHDLSFKGKTWAMAWLRVRSLGS